MALECTLIIETAPPIPFTVADGTGIEKGAVLKLTDPMTAATTTGDTDACAGIAAAAKLDGKKTKVYCLLGDGECDEGLIWEAAMLASHIKLDNLIAIVDRNMLQIDGCTEDVICLEPFADKWRAFNWNVMEIDGHDMAQVVDALETAKTIKDIPTVIIAQTVKGKGVSFMEDVASWHGMAPNQAQTAQALSEIEEATS